MSQETRNYIGEWQSLLKMPILSFWLFCGILTSLLMFGKGYSKLKPSALFVTGVAVLLALSSARHGLLFIAAGMPVAMQGMRNLLAFVEQERRGQEFTVREQHIYKASLIFLFSISALALGIITHDRPLQIMYPEGAAVFLQQQAEQGKIGNIYNEYGWGGYLIWKAPSVPVFIDGRMPHWVDEDGNSAMKDYVQVKYSSDKDRWREVFEKRAITHALLAKQHKPYTFHDYLQTLLAQLLSSQTPRSFQDMLVDNGWRVSYEDHVSIVLQK